MNRIVRTGLLSLLLATVVSSALVLNAQDRGARFDPEQMRQMIMNRMKERLGASDEEWNIIAPRLEKVWELQRESRMIGFGGGFFGGPMGGPGGLGAPRGEQDRSGQPRDDRGPRRGMAGFGQPESPEAAALQQVLDADTPSPAEIKEKLAAFRDARKKKEEELKKSQEELKQVLTIRQEALLVLMGTLD